MNHYYVSSVVITTAKPPHFQIMEEEGGRQTCIAMVPFNKHHSDARRLAKADADLIVKALNFHEEHAT